MSLIKSVGAGEQSTGFYKLLLDQSIKFNDADSPYLRWAPASQGSLTTFTFSFWYKRCVFGTYQEVFHEYPGSGERSQILFMNNDTLKVELEAANTNHFITNRVFRDPSAWYNIVVAFDSTNGTEASRVKIYVNGVDESDTANGGGGFSTANYPSQNATSGFNRTNDHEISTYDGSDYHLDGYLAEVNFIDGTALTAASFGETKNGIWIPKDTSGLTFGTNGFHLTFKDDVVSEGFNAVTWRGTAADNSISGLGFSPAFVWIKDRTDATANYLFDVNRGALKDLYSNLTNAQYSAAQTLKSFDADGFTVGNNTGVNGSADDMVAWCWEAGGTPTANNTAGAGATPTAGSVKIDGSNLGSALAGTIPATKLTANTSKGFSIVQFEGTETAGSVAHGLSSAPKFIIAKNIDSTTEWPVYHESANSGGGSYLRLDGNAANTSSSIIWTDSPSSTVVNIGTYEYVNRDTMIMYCFAEVSGYSKFGSFTGNGGSQAIDVGFEPALVILRRTNGGTWGIFDNTRQTSGADRNLQMLAANSTAVETTNSQMTFSGNTFNDNGYLSDSGATVLYMAFADTREAAFFKDVSGNGQHWAPNNLDYRDSVPDTPTNNFATFNALNLPAAAVLSEGNTKFTQTSNDRAAIGNMAMSSGKWYYEVYYTAGTNPEAGLARVKDSFANSGATGSSDKFLYITNATSFRTPAWTSTDATGVSAQTSETILGFAIDADNGKAFISVNGTYINSGDPAAGSNPQATFDADWVTQTGGGVVPFIGVYTGTSADVRINFGQDSSFSGAKATANSNADGEGHGSFAYAPPSGFLALCSQNLPDVDIIDGTEHFNTVTYTGDGTSSRDLEGFGFQPGFVWLKERGAVNNHILVNGGRGADKGIHSDSESTLEFSGVTSAFTSDGITLTNHGTVNNNSDTYVAWAWKGTESFSNDTSATSVGNVDSSGLVNTTAGFSFTTWTADGSVKNIAHGMGKVPTTIWTKPNEDNWFYVYHAGTASDAETDYLALSRTDAVADYTMWNDTAPTSSLWTVGVASHNSGSNEEHISFLFSDVEGFSKNGSYVGNGNADGPFIFTGHRVSWLMIKRTDAIGHWQIYDAVRHPNNVNNDILYANLNNAESSGSSYAVDFLSNGFKVRTTGGDINASGGNFIYVAFADQPFKFANAR